MRDDVKWFGVQSSIFKSERYSLFLGCFKFPANFSLERCVASKQKVLAREFKVLILFQHPFQVIVCFNEKLPCNTYTSLILRSLLNSIFRALILSVLVIWLVAGTAIAVGLVVYANYWSCDPMKREIIVKKDELVTLFVLEHLVDYTGVPGLFIASLLCGALRFVNKRLRDFSS